MFKIEPLSGFVIFVPYKTDGKFREVVSITILSLWKAVSGL